MLIPRTIETQEGSRPGANPYACRHTNERGVCGLVAILDLAAMVQQFSPMRVASEDVWGLIPRIDVRHETIINEVDQRHRAA
jgi:hypothetical protein